MDTGFSQVDMNSSLGPVENSVIYFRVNGLQTTHYAFWRGSGVPADPSGIDLRLGIDGKVSQAEFVSGPVSIEALSAASESQFVDFLRAKQSRHALVTSNGQLLSYVLDAPQFVNARFREAFPEMRLAGTLAILVAPTS